MSLLHDSEQHNSADTVGDVSVRYFQCIKTLYFADLQETFTDFAGTQDVQVCVTGLRQN